MGLFQTEWLLRIICAVFTGSLIGFERHNRSKEAGIRTHAIVALAACVLMIISKYGFEESVKSDPARIAAQVVSGIGFLGAGMIFVQRDTIQGLTTAAGIWATSMLGMCFGIGMYAIGFFSCFLIIVVQVFFPRILSYNPPRSVVKIALYLTEDGTVKDVNDAIRKLNLSHGENSVHRNEDKGWRVETEIVTHREVDPNELIRELEKHGKILKVEIR